MTTAYILILTGRGATPAVTARVAEIPGVTQVDTVLQHFDVIARARTEDMDGLTALVAQVDAVAGITRRMVCWREES